MKKIITMLCAYAVALSVNAAPQFGTLKEKGTKLQVTQSVVKTDKQMLEQRLAKAKSVNERDELILRYKLAQKGAKAQKAQATKAFRANAPKAKRDAQEVTIVRIGSTLDTESNTIFYGLHTDEIAFYFEIPVAEGARDIELGRTYTLSEMNADRCEWDDEDWNEHYYTAATFTKTKGANYDVHIAATVTDVDGNQFTLAYDEEEVIATGDTVQVAIATPLNTMDYMSYTNQWLLRARDNSAFVQLLFYGESGDAPVGIYTAEDFDLTNTQLIFPTGELDEWEEPIERTVTAKDASAVITASESRTDISALIFGDDGVVYEVSLYYALPEKESEDTLTATNLYFDDWAYGYGHWEFYASDENGVNIGLQLYPESEGRMLGDFAITPNGYSGGDITVGGSQYGIYSGSVNVAYNVSNGQYTVTGTVLAWNNVEYTLNLTTPEAVVTPLTFSASDLILDIYAEDEEWQIKGFNAAGEYITLNAKATAVAGDYTADDFIYDYTFVSFMDEDEEDVYYVLQDANVHVTFVDSVASVSGTLLLANLDNRYDMRLYTLDITAAPYVPEVRNVTVGHLQISYQETEEEEPAVYYELASSDGRQIFGFAFIADKWDLEIELGKDYSLDDLYPEYSFGVNFDLNEYIYYNSFTFRKEMSADSVVTITATVVDQRGNTWQISYSGEYVQPEGRAWLTLGQANLGPWEDGDGLSYEMVDVNNSFKCVLVFNLAGVEDVEAEEVYSTADSIISTEFSYLSFNDTEHKVASATFLKEVYDDEVEISATVIDERGFVFTLYFHDDGFVLTGDTIEMVFNAEVSANYDEDTYVWYIYSEGTENIVNFVIESTESSPVGTYEEYDIALWNSHIEELIDAEENNWSYIGLHSLDYLTISEIEGGYALEAVVIGEDGNVYHVAINKASEAIDEVHAGSQAIKYLMNGQLIIEKNGVKYNAQGVILK